MALQDIIYSKFYSYHSGLSIQSLLLASASSPSSESRVPQRSSVHNCLYFFISTHSLSEFIQGHGFKYKLYTMTTPKFDSNFLFSYKSRLIDPAAYLMSPSGGLRDTSNLPYQKLTPNLFLQNVVLLQLSLPQLTATPCFQV